MENTKPDGGPAFPAIGDSNTPGGAPYPFNEGMSLRDHFAGLAMAGMCASTDYEARTYEQAAENAYKQADAMIAERSK